MPFLLLLSMQQHLTLMFNTSAIALPPLISDTMDLLQTLYHALEVTKAAGHSEGKSPIPRNSKSTLPTDRGTTIHEAAALTFLLCDILSNLEDEVRRRHFIFLRSISHRRHINC